MINMPDTNPNKMISTKVVADRLGVSIQTILDMIQRQEIAAIKVGKQYRITEGEYADYIARNRTDKKTV